MHALDKVSARGGRREQSAVTADAYVPLSFAPGEAYQFDWSHEIVVVNGMTTKVKVAPRCVSDRCRRRLPGYIQFKTPWPLGATR